MDWLDDDPGDEPYTKCPYCGERVDPKEPGVVYAYPQVESVAFGPTRHRADGIGAFFHPRCWPMRGYRQAQPPNR